jgi:hypothetical protein
MPDVLKKKKFPEPNFMFDGYKMLMPIQQMKLFKTCVYVASLDSVFIGKYHTQDFGYKSCCYSERKFNGLFGGYRFLIGCERFNYCEYRMSQSCKCCTGTLNIIEPGTEFNVRTTNNAWTAFLYSNLVKFPKVNTLYVSKSVKNPFVKVDVDSGFTMLAVAPGTKNKTERI